MMQPIPPTLAPADLARQRLDAFAGRIADLRAALRRTIVGQDAAIDQLLTCALVGGHAMLVGVPGLAKTLMVKAFASAFDWRFARIQFTPDLMPADITGFELLDASHGGGVGSTAMTFRPGPLFANLVLADEINRATPKTQSALLEAMAEHHVSVGGVTRPLADPFLVVATRNPIEQEGTYPLPEAQLDRFLMEVHVDYPSPREEERIVLETSGAIPPLPGAILTRDDYLSLRELVWAAPVPQHVAAFAVALCGATRPGDARASAFVNDYVAWGAGPRGSQGLVRAAKAHALLDGRPAPGEADVRAVAVAVLRHRVIVNGRAIADGIDSIAVLDRVLREVRS